MSIFIKTNPCCCIQLCTASFFVIYDECTLNSIDAVTLVQKHTSSIIQFQTRCIFQHVTSLLVGIKMLAFRDSQSSFLGSRAQCSVDEPFPLTSSGNGYANNNN